MRDLVLVRTCFLIECCPTFLLGLFALVLAAISCPSVCAAATGTQVQGETAGHTPLLVPSTKPKRIIEARLLVKLVRDGANVHITNATIRGPLDMSYSVVNQQVSLINCEFEEGVDFSYSTFKRQVVLQGSTFRKGVTFESTTFELNAVLDGIRFLAGNARFKDIHVKGLFDMRDAQFSNGVEAIFVRAHFDKAADFSRSVFAKATFSDAEVGSDLFFQEARFQKETILTTAKIAGSIFLDGAEFEGLVAFAGIQITYNARMKGVVFKRGANFSDAQINSFLDLSGAKFESRAMPVHFDRARIAGSGSFDDAHFASGGAQFNGTHFNSDVSFDRTVFDGPVSFERARFDQTAHLEKSTFMKDVIFHETSFGALDLSPNGRIKGQDQLQARVDLRGCTYGRIQARWQSLLRMPNGNSRLIGYDRQPYFQLEKFYQGVGDDQTANKVFLEWHHVRRQELFQSSKIRWLIDCVPWITTNYGVAPGRLLEISLIFLFFGMLIFSRPGAVFSDGGEGKESGSREGTTVQLSHWDAVALSVHQFLPLDVPFGSQWTPGGTAVELKFCRHNLSLTVVRMRPTTCATLLKICGYILVPLEILVLNGLIKGGQLALPWE